MLGTAAVAMWWDVAPEARAEWEDWHSTEHMPERLAIPGFLRGTRWVAESGEPSYFVSYEVASLETLTGGAYLERLNNPTPWSRKMMPHHRNMVRSLCVLRAGWGGGLPRTLATVPEEYLLGNKAMYLFAYNNVKTAYSKDGYFSEAGAKTTLKALAASNPKLKPEEIRLAETYTNEFVKKALAKYAKRK